ncbi:MAG TPA: hypothetical protein PLQ54_17785 [Armatimonadota bacterium]|nr:hypothetical protein [Armatimonadota bacterium]
MRHENVRARQSPYNRTVFDISMANPSINPYMPQPPHVQAAIDDYLAGRSDSPYLPGSGLYGPQRHEQAGIEPYRSNPWSDPHLMRHSYEQTSPGPWQAPVAVPPASAHCPPSLLQHYLPIPPPSQPAADRFWDQHGGTLVGGLIFGAGVWLASLVLRRPL